MCSTRIPYSGSLDLWSRYDENDDGTLDKEEAKHMVIDLAEPTAAAAVGPGGACRGS